MHHEIQDLLAEMDVDGNPPPPFTGLDIRKECLEAKGSPNDHNSPEELKYEPSVRSYIALKN